MKSFTALVALVLILAACGGSDADDEVATLEDTTETTQAPVGEQETDAEESLLEFAQCMRDNGVPDFPDPQLDSSGNIRPFGGAGGPGQLDADQDTLEAAFEACSEIVEGLIQDAFRMIDQTEFQDNFLEFAECMRENGIDMPDPDFSQGFGPGLGRGLFGDIDPDDPAFQDAAEECSSVFEGSFDLRPGSPGGDDTP
jgi:hypothetical protein